MSSNNVPVVTPEDQIRNLQSQVSILEQQIKLASLQQTQASAEQTSLLTSLKAQVSAQGDLDKLRAQGDFAKLAGIKAGLDSVGAPVGKDGSITVSTGTSGALLLSLRKPMLEGLEDSATNIASAIKGSSTSVYIGTDAQVQSALQASVTDSALEQAVIALDESTANARRTLGGTTRAASILATAAAAGLALNTAVGLEKFFRVDTAYSVFDAGDEAQQTLLSMLERKLSDVGVDYNNLGTVSIPTVLAESAVAQQLLLGLKQQYELGSAISAEVDQLKAEDPRRPPQNIIDRLKVDLSVAKASLDALHPALKPEGFWGYVQGRTARNLMQLSDTDASYRCRLVVSAKAQTIQVVEKRTWRSDKIFGRSDIQIEYRLLEPSGKQKISGITLATFASDKAPKTEPLFKFPSATAPVVPALTLAPVSPALGAPAGITPTSAAPRARDHEKAT